MATKQTDSNRPEGHPAQAVWPPRVPFKADPVTYEDGAVARKAPVPEGGFGVRVGSTPFHGDTVREDGKSEMPTEGPGVARRAIPAPEEAVTTSTIPPPYVMTFDGRKAEPGKADGGDIAPPTPPVSRADVAAVSNPPGATTVHDAPSPKAAARGKAARKVTNR